MSPEALAGGLWRWTARHPEWHPGEFGAAVACFALDTGEETLLVDPLVVEEDALDGIAGERVSILVSIPYHTRSSELLAERYGATIHGHPAVAKRLRSTKRFEPLDLDAAAAAGGAPLPGGARAFAIGRPRRFETPLWLPSHAALVFGDAVVETGGELRVWAEGAVDEQRRRFVLDRFNPTLAPLVGLGAERVLVTHGEPVLSGGAGELARALEREPFWHHG